MATSNLGYQSFYQAQLTAAISDTDLTIPLDVVPTPSEGFLVIESTSSTKREIIYYTSKTANSVVCPAGGRGYDGTTAQSHLQNSAVIMAPVAAMFSSMRDLFETTPQGWTPVTQTVSSVTYNGQRSYNLTMSADVSATLSPGMRVRTTRTVSAPTQCTSLNGTTQYWNDTTINGMTFTDDFVVSAWIKITGSNTAPTVVSRWNGNSGWVMQILSTGGIELYASNTSSANFKRVSTRQAIPLNKWVHVAAQLDMSAITGTDTGIGATTNYIMLDGVSVPVTTTQGGTNPTTLIQAGNLEIGSYNGGNAISLFPGKIAQVAIFSAKVTQATMQGYISQGLTGTETNLVSAYSFNGNANDLNTTNVNNLTAQGSAVATNADSPFSTNSFGTETGTLDYGIITNVATTTLTVQVPEGCTIPTSGGVSAMSYSTQKVPYGMPISVRKWEIATYLQALKSTPTPTSGTGVDVEGLRLYYPVGDWLQTVKVALQQERSAAGIVETTLILADSAGSTTIGSERLTANIYRSLSTTGSYLVIDDVFMQSTFPFTSTGQTKFFTMTAFTTGMNNMSIRGDRYMCYHIAIPAYL